MNLTERQLEVLTWTARGKSASVIGIILGIKTCTVTEHRRNILRIFNVDAIVTACVKAALAGLISLERD